MFNDCNAMKCGHCDGKGACSRGDGGWSCRSCIDQSGQATLFYHITVTCSVCDGTGWVKPTDRSR